MINMFLYREFVIEPKQWRSQEVEVEGQKSPPLSSPPLPSLPLSSLPSPLPSLTARGVWERYKLAQRQPPAILVHFRSKRKLLVGFKFTTVA